MHHLQLGGSAISTSRRRPFAIIQSLGTLLQAASIMHPEPVDELAAEFEMIVDEANHHRVGPCLFADLPQALVEEINAFALIHLCQK